MGERRDSKSVGFGIQEKIAILDKSGRGNRDSCWATLCAKGTGKRMELLRYVRRNSVVSIRALAKALGREHSNVHADVKALASAGLLDASKKGVRAEYDVIESRIAI